jgi:hypothetical protein
MFDADIVPAEPYVTNGILHPIAAVGVPAAESVTVSKPFESIFAVAV